MISYLAIAALLLVSYYVTKTIRSSVVAYRFKRAHGCQPEHKFPQSERILGLGLYFTFHKTVREKTRIAAGRKRFADNGPTFSTVMMGVKVHSTMDPENIKAVLATNFSDFGLGQRLRTFGPLLGKGIFSTDGAEWKHSRALIRPSFTRSQVADLDIFETHVKHLISKIPRDGSTVDLQPLFFQFTLDAATEFLFGESVNSLGSTEGSPQHRFGAAFDYAQANLGRQGWIDKFTSLFVDSEFTKSCKFVHEFVDRIIDNELAKKTPADLEKAAKFDAPERYVFLEELIRLTQDKKQLRDELLNILVAGRDTTASLLSHTFHVLARRPDMYKKLVTEVSDLDGKIPSYEDIKSMGYLKNLLRESLRLYPVVPGNARFANKDTTLPHGGGPDGLSPVYIPKGGIVNYSVSAMHVRPDIYGPDANEFRPERWNAEEGLKPGWAYLPFNGGPRICVGQQFALVEASYTIVRLVQEFGKVENRDELPWTEKIGLTLSIDTGVKVAMIPV